MAETGTRDAGWTPLVAKAPEPDHIRALLAGEYPYVRVPGFLESGWCREIVRRFHSFMESHPDHRVRLRPTPQNDVTVDAVALPIDFFFQSKPPQWEAYLSRVPVDQPAVRALFEGGPDPLALVREFLAGAGWTMQPAFEGARPYMTDIVWGAVGVREGPPHVDTYHIEGDGSLSHFRKRCSFNTFLQAPERGGNFRIYRWRKDDGPFNSKNANIWAEYAVVPGDLVVFDGYNFHEVRAMGGARHRLLSHMAVGFDDGARRCTIFA